MSDPGLTSQRSPLLRPVAIGVVCVALAGGALWFNFAPRQEAPAAPVQPPQAIVPPPPVTAPPPQAAAPPPAAVATIAPPALAPASVAAAAPPPAAAPAPVAEVAKPAAEVAKPAAEPAKPSFDIVRVNPQGDAVIAGRAAPDTQVTVSNNGKEIGKTQSDAQGQWAMVPAAPIAPGGNQLTVASKAPDQQPVKGDAPVVVLVPDQPKPAAAPAVAAAAPAAAVAVLTPDNAAPKLLQPPPPATAATAPLGLGTVDYTGQGDIRFAGTAPPGATVRTYVDNQPAGDAAVDASGHWTLVPLGQVAAGEHKLRMDQVGPDGRVASRIELPFRRAELSPQDVAAGQIVVQPGQNLWRIARRAYGRGIQYLVIYQANREQIRDPNLIYPGQAFAMPAPAAGVAGATMPPASSTSR